MKLSKRSEYGLKALLDLAASYGQGMLQVPQIADRHGISPKFLELILLDLRRAGIVHSRQGHGGGYYLARPPEAVTIGEVVRTLDGTLAPLRCVSRIAYERCTCPDEATCALRLIMLQVRDAIADVLDHSTLADIAHHAVDDIADGAGVPITVPHAILIDQAAGPAVISASSPARPTR